MFQQGNEIEYIANRNGGYLVLVAMCWYIKYIHYELIYQWKRFPRY